jgi:hypothetical protein
MVCRAEARITSLYNSIRLGAPVVPDVKNSMVGVSEYQRFRKANKATSQFSSEEGVALVAISGEIKRPLRKIGGNNFQLPNPCIVQSSLILSVIG